MEEHYPEILRQYMGEERVGSSENYGNTTKQATDICGRCQSTTDAAKGAEPVSREERSVFCKKVRPIEENALRKYAVEDNLWMNENDFLAKYKDRLLMSLPII
ncbi:MAG: hypothetical protein JWQ09_5676 [Segetibacter sp.]|nr:hypothetical protein [Segetibacter sp.]